MSLVSIGGEQIIRGGNNLCNGPVDRINPAVLEAVMNKLLAEGFEHSVTPAGDAIAAAAVDHSIGDGGLLGDRGAKRRKIEHTTTATTTTTTAGSAGRYEGLSISRSLYARMYGPTTGDVIRLADTELFIRVEHDHTVYGDEC